MKKRVTSEDELVYTYYCEDCLGVHKINEVCPNKRDRRLKSQLNRSDKFNELKGVKKVN